MNTETHGNTDIAHRYLYTTQTHSHIYRHTDTYTQKRRHTQTHTYQHRDKQIHTYPQTQT